MHHEFFCESELRKFFVYIKSNRSLVFFDEAKGDGHELILRHDIDYSLRSALQMAHLESEMGIKATYFFLVSSAHYNLYSQEGTKAIEKIINLGHKIGLHFDENIYDTNLDEHLNSELQLLKSITGTGIDVMSLHNPHVQGTYKIYENILNSYSPEFFDKDRYLSDSCFKFKQDPYEFLKLQKSLQILLHPIHFFQSLPNYVNVLNNLLDEFKNSLEKSFMYNETYVAELEYRNKT